MAMIFGNNAQSKTRSNQSKCKTIKIKETDNKNSKNKNLQGKKIKCKGKYLIKSEIFGKVKLTYKGLTSSARKQKI